MNIKLRACVFLSVLFVLQLANASNDAQKNAKQVNDPKSVAQSILEYIQHTKIPTPLVFEMEEREGRPIAPSDTGLWMALRAIRPKVFEQMKLDENNWKIDYIAAAHQINVLDKATSQHDTMYQTTFVLARKPMRDSEPNEVTYIRPDTAVTTDRDFYVRTCYANILYQFNQHLYQYWALQCYQ